jgi:hypothetical protein
VREALSRRQLGLLIRCRAGGRRSSPGQRLGSQADGVLPHVKGATQDSVGESVASSGHYFNRWFVPSYVKPDLKLRRFPGLEFPTLRWGTQLTDGLKSSQLGAHEPDLVFDVENMPACFLGAVARHGAKPGCHCGCMMGCPGRAVLSPPPPDWF